MTPVRASVLRIPVVARVNAHVSPRTGSLIALVFGAVLIGMSTVASEAALRDLGPLTLAFMRFLVASAALLAISFRRGTRPDFGMVPTILGISGVTFAFTFQNIGLQHINAMNATLIIEGSVPIVTAALGAMLLREELTAKRIVGLLLAVGGVTAVILQDGGDTGEFSLRGGLLTLFAGVWFAVYTVAGRWAFAGEVSLPILTGSVVIGMVTLLPGALYEGVTVGPGRFTPEAVGWVLLLGLGGSALAHVLWAHGLAHVEATEVGIIGTLMPVAAVGLAALILGEPMTAIQIGGTILVVAGLGVTTMPIRQNRAREEVAWRASDRESPAPDSALDFEVSQRIRHRPEDIDGGTRDEGGFASVPSASMAHLSPCPAGTSPEWTGPLASSMTSLPVIGGEPEIVSGHG